MGLKQTTRRVVSIVDTANETRWGATLGVGIEYAIAQNWSLGFEYDHLFMGNRDVNSPAGLLIADHIKEDVDLFTAPELQVWWTGICSLLI
jgi:outer membrane immunogenic protein